MIRILKQIFRTGIVTEPIPPITDPEIEKIGVKLEAAVQRRFRGSLAIRQVDAGSCNGCELEIHAINNATGKPVLERPVTPWKILRALGKA